MVCERHLEVTRAHEHLRQTSLVLPQNIKHQFGSRVCDKLLSDKEIVDKTIQDQKDFKASIQRTSKKFDVPKFTKDLNPEYEMLGNALRMNVVPGYTIDHKVSTTKTAFNDQVHLFRYPDPDKYRYQKDELSEYNVSFPLSIGRFYYIIIYVPYYVFLYLIMYLSCMYVHNHIFMYIITRFP